MTSLASSPPSPLGSQDSSSPNPRDQQACSTSGLCDREKSKGHVASRTPLSPQTRTKIGQGLGATRTPTRPVRDIILASTVDGTVAHSSTSQTLNLMSGRSLPSEGTQFTIGREAQLMAQEDQLTSVIQYMNSLQADHPDRIYMIQTAERAERERQKERAKLAHMSPIPETALNNMHTLPEGGVNTHNMFTAQTEQLGIPERDQNLRRPQLPSSRSLGGDGISIHPHQAPDRYSNSLFPQDEVRGRGGSRSDATAYYYQGVPHNAPKKGPLNNDDLHREFLRTTSMMQAESAKNKQWKRGGRPTTVKPFKGTQHDSYAIFEQRFMDWIQRDQIHPENWIAFFVGRLEGLALLYFETLSAEIRADFSAIREKFQGRYNNREQRKLAYSRLRALEQRDDQPVEEWIHIVRTLVGATFGINHPAADQEIFDTLATQSRRDLRNNMAHVDVETPLEDVYNKLRRWDDLETIGQNNTLAYANHKVTMASHVPVDPMEYIQTVYAAQQRINTCFGCGEVGHFRRECPHPQERPNTGPQRVEPPRQFAPRQNDVRGPPPHRYRQPYKPTYQAGSTYYRGQNAPINQRAPMAAPPRGPSSVMCPACKTPGHDFGDCYMVKRILEMQAKHVSQPPKPDEPEHRANILQGWEKEPEQENWGYEYENIYPQDMGMLISEVGSGEDEPFTSNQDQPQAGSFLPNLLTDYQSQFATSMLATAGLPGAMANADGMHGDPYNVNCLWYVGYFILLYLIRIICRAGWKAFQSRNSDTTEAHCSTDKVMNSEPTIATIVTQNEDTEVDLDETIKPVAWQSSANKPWSIGIITLVALILTDSVEARQIPQFGITGFTSMRWEIDLGNYTTFIMVHTITWCIVCILMYVCAFIRAVFSQQIEVANKLEVNDSDSSEDSFSYEPEAPVRRRLYRNSHRQSVIHSHMVTNTTQLVSYDIVTIYGNAPGTLLDTGATDNYISAKYFRFLKHKFGLKEYKYHHNVRLSTNDYVTCNHACRLPIIIRQGHFVLTTTHIMHDLPMDLALGMHFISKFEAVTLTGGTPTLKTPKTDWHKKIKEGLLTFMWTLTISIHVFALLTTMTQSHPPPQWKPVRVKRRTRWLGMTDYGHIVAHSTSQKCQQLSPTVIVKIGPISANALIDTGATMTIISEKLATDLRCELRPSDIRAIDASNGHIKFLGECWVEVELIPGVPIKQCVQVQQNAPFSVLIGVDHLKEYGQLTINFKTHKLTTDLGEAPLIERQLPRHCYTLRIGECIALPPRTETFISVQAPKLQYPEVLYEPNTESLNSRSLLSGPTLNMAGTRIVVPVLNPTDEVQELPKGFVMGLLTPVDLENQLPPLIEKTIKAIEEPQWELLNNEDRSNAQHVLTTLEKQVIQPKPRFCSLSKENRERYFNPERVDALLKVMKLESVDAANKEQVALRDFIVKNADMFALDTSELGNCTVLKQIIETGDARPLRQPAYPIPPMKREIIKEQINKMLKDGLIRPSKSPWAAPVLLVPKSDGTARFCVDYRKLNTVTRKDSYPLPRINDVLDSLNGNKYFSSLDLHSGFHQIQVHPDSIEKTAFITFMGLYEYLYMPFGTCNGPPIFQRIMEMVLAEHLYTSVFVYVDDLLVTGKTFEEHMTNMDNVLAALRTADLKLKPSKCKFLCTEVPFLGYIIDQTGIRPDKTNIAAVLDYEFPPGKLQVKHVQQFLGMATFYRRFIQDFSTIAAPLYALTQKSADLKWNIDSQTAFMILKRRLTTAPVLVYPDFAKKFSLSTDASGIGIGAVLSQTDEDGHEHPIAYTSRLLGTSERNYSATEREGLAVVYAMKYFRHYLSGSLGCDVFTDHQALVRLMHTNEAPSPRIAGWQIILMGEDYNVIYRPGKLNENADCMSRLPSQVQNATLANAVQPPGLRHALDVCFTMIQNMAKEKHIALAEVQLSPSQGELEQAKCTWLTHMKKFIEHKDLPEDAKLARAIAMRRPCFALIEGNLYEVGHPRKPCFRWVVPPHMKKFMLTNFHDVQQAGHRGITATYQKLSGKFYWDGMMNDIMAWIKSCRECQTRKSRPNPSAPLGTLPLATYPWERAAMDIVGPLQPTSRGFKYILVITDYCTRYCEAFPMKNQEAETVADILVQKIFCRYGTIAYLLSDRGGNFISRVVKRVCEIFATRRITTSAWNPKCDGLTERCNQTLIKMLKCYASKCRDWDKCLPHIVFAANTCMQATTKFSPHELLYGREVVFPIEVMLETRQSLLNDGIFVDNLTDRLKEAWQLAKDNIEAAHTRQKIEYDKRMRVKTHTYRLGDLIRLKVEYPIEKQLCPKLQTKFEGVYKIVTIHNNSDIVDILKIKGLRKSGFQTVHVNRLRPIINRPVHLQTTDEGDEYVPIGPKMRPQIDDEPSPLEEGLLELDLGFEMDDIDNASRELREENTPPNPETLRTRADFRKAGAPPPPEIHMFITGYWRYNDISRMY